MTTHGTLEQRIQELDNRLLRLASSMGVTSLSPRTAEPRRPDDVLLNMAKAEYRNRRRRESVLDSPGLFADPAWDILLDLYIARHEGKRIATSSACIAACVPVTTALRWLTALKNEGLIRKLADRDDKRRVHVEITDTAFARLTRYFEESSR